MTTSGMTGGAGTSLAGDLEFVTFAVAGQWLGLPVTDVQEVLFGEALTPIPLAPHEVAGFRNLRGQIVTAIDLRRRLGLPDRAPEAPSMHVVVRANDELFALVADDVGDVVAVEAHALAEPPASLAVRWRGVAAGVVRRPDDLLVAVQVTALLDVVTPSA